MSVPVLTEAAALLARYDVLISDVWGVVHDGVLALDPACEAYRAMIMDWAPMREWIAAAQEEPDELEELDVEF